MTNNIKALVLQGETVDTWKYRYRLVACENAKMQWCEIRRLPLVYLDTTAALTEWETVEADTKIYESHVGRGALGNRWYREILYRTQAGKWFILAEGGSETVYGNERGMKVIPVRPEDAFAWAILHIPHEMWEKLMPPDIMHYKMGTYILHRSKAVESLMNM